METFLRRPEVERITGLSSSEIYRRIKIGKFPKPIQLGGVRAVAWKQSSVEQWQSDCEAVGWHPDRLAIAGDEQA